MPNLTYTNSIPLGTDNPSVSQGQMKTNCESVNSLVNVDLIGFNDNNGGFHSKSTYVDQGSDPGSAALQVVEFAKSVIYSGEFGTFSELFIQRDGTGTAPLQLTSGPAAAGGTTSFGQSFLPGGFQLRFGAENAGSGNFVYSDAPRNLSPFPNGTICVFLSANDNGRQYNTTALSNTGFTFASPSGLGGFLFWLAIGY